MEKCASCGSTIDDAFGVCGKCNEAAWERNGKPLRALYSKQDLAALRIGTPVLSAWCCWGKILTEESPQVGGATAGAAVGYLLGGIQGVDLGRAIGEAVGAAKDAPEARLAAIREAGQAWNASLGIVALTDTEVLIVDCGCTAVISATGVRSAQVEMLLDHRRQGQLTLRISRAPREKVRSIVRHEGVVLQLTGLDVQAWQIELARISGEPDASAFVRAILNITDLPPANEFVQHTSCAPDPPPAAVLDAMLAEGSYVDKVLKLLGSMDRSQAATFIANVSSSGSRGFVVPIEAWLVDRELRARSLRGTALAMGLGAIVCGWWAFYQLTAATDDPFGAHMIGIFASVCAVGLLAATAIVCTKAAKAKWYAEQLAGLRARLGVK